MRLQPAPCLLVPCATVLALTISPPAVSIDTDCAPAVTVCTAEEINAIPVRTLANMHWLMQLTPSGYSDFGIVTKGPYPRTDPRDPEGPAPLHEMLSGEWAAAVEYDSQPPIWLEQCFRYPDWKTNSNFAIVETPDFSADLDADGINEGSSLIRNPDLDIRIHYDFDIVPGGMALGKGSADPGRPFETSNPFVFMQTYDIKNTTMRTLHSVSLYQFTHSHPANTETPTASIGWDDAVHAGGGLPGFRYDITGFAWNSGIIDNYDTGSTFDDHVGFSSSVMPAAHGLGSYRGHLQGDNGLPSSGGMKPVTGEHCDIENRALSNESTLLQDEVAGSMRFDLGDLAPGEMKSLTLALAIQTRAHGVPATSCMRVVEDRTANVEIDITRGPCSRQGGDPLGTPVDIVFGSVYDLALVSPCDASFDCTQLTSLHCLAQGHTTSEYQLDEDAHRLDVLFYLARPSGQFSSWGQGQPTAGSLPIERFFFTPSTAPGVDACDVIP